jgi:hypothetical protein
MGRKAWLALCVAVVACTSIAFAASSASAVVTQCPSGRFCFWRDTGFVSAGSGYNYFGFLNWSYEFRVHTYLGTTTTVNDNSSSWHQNGNTNYGRMYIDEHYGGNYSGPKAPGDSQNAMTTGWADETSSACFIYGTNGGCIGP